MFSSSARKQLRNNHVLSELCSTIIIYISVGFNIGIDWKHVGGEIKINLLCRLLADRLDRHLQLVLQLVINVHFAALNVAGNLVEIPEGFANIPALLQV